MGTIHSVKDKYGFIKCYSKQELVFYHINECDEHIQFEVGDEVDFLLVKDTRGGHELKATSVRFVRSTSIFGIGREETSPSVSLLTGNSNITAAPTSEFYNNLHNDTGNANNNNNTSTSTSQLVLDKRGMLDWINTMLCKEDGEILLLYINQLQLLLNQVSPLFPAIPRYALFSLLSLSLSLFSLSLFSLFLSPSPFVLSPPSPSLIAIISFLG